MPTKDGTGPRGQGPLTGRGFGSCAGDTRRGFGRGYGRKPWCRGTTSTAELTKEEKQKILKAELAEIDAEKIAVEKELKELK